MKKPTVLYKARQAITIFAVCICVMAIVVVSACKMPASIETPTMGKEEIIQEYISYLSEIGDPTKTKRDNAINIELPGMGTESSALPSQVDSTTVREDQYVSVAVQQHNLVITQFGPDAWDNVIYTLEEIDPVDGILGYRIISTGEFISESEYNRLLRKYWENIAKQEGITYYDIFLADGESVEGMENKRVDVIAKYSDGIPVEHTTISDAQTYSVQLSFNGDRLSNQKYENFHFIIDNRNGNWSVFQGLTWTEPYPEFPEGD
ncbi:hypothetical protein ACX1C1_19710 [Paenibacillus sp. strain BS8-2]